MEAPRRWVVVLTLVAVSMVTYLALFVGQALTMRGPRGELMRSFAEAKHQPVGVPSGFLDAGDRVERLELWAVPVVLLFLVGDAYGRFSCRFVAYDVCFPVLAYCVPSAILGLMPRLTHILAYVVAWFVGAALLRAVGGQIHRTEADAR